MLKIQFKGELQPKISLLHMKVLTLIKAKNNVFLWYVQCCSCTRRSKTKILTTRAPPSWIEFDVVTSQRCDILNMTCDCWFPCSCVYWSLVKARKIVWESHVIDSSSITQSEALWVWRWWRHNVKLNPRWRRPSCQYFGFRSSHAATSLHVSKKNITFCFNQGYYSHM